MNEATRRPRPSDTGRVAAEALPLRMVMTQMMLHTHNYYGPEQDDFDKTEKKVRENVNKLCPQLVINEEHDYEKSKTEIN